MPAQHIPWHEDNMKRKRYTRRCTALRVSVILPGCHVFCFSCVSPHGSSFPISGNLPCGTLRLGSLHRDHCQCLGSPADRPQAVPIAQGQHTMPSVHTAGRLNPRLRSYGGQVRASSGRLWPQLAGGEQKCHCRNGVYRIRKAKEIN